ncbi:MAG: hypothetical protein Q4F26_06135 [Atopococcus tabaci]|uniref:TcaA protein NTF2-like domain-containing protein n=1 Tax=Atopococcus tabaci TaxID=269774 RepID=A0AA43UDF7_9LACT|nr:hypothetical protein [Atopococcus tabaci]
MSNKDAPENVNLTFMFFKEEKVSDHQSVGSLYIKKENDEVLLIDSNVLDKSVYDNDTEQVLFLDEESSLFRYQNNIKAIEKIDTNVQHMYFSDTPDKKIVYYTDDNSVYIYGDSKSTKIGSDISKIELLNEDVYYSDYDSNLYSYNIETHEEKRISSNAFDFRLMDDGQSVAYTDDNGALYYINLEEETEVKIASGWVNITSIAEADENIYYIEENSGGSTNLYVANVVENTRPEIITEDVSDFKFHKNNIIYQTSDLGLYQFQEDNISKRISTDVNSFDILDNKIIYLDTNDTLYSWNQENDEESQIGHNTSSYQYFSNGRIFYLTNDGDLFNENIKLASDVDSYSSFYNTLVYAADDSLYIVKDENTDESNEEFILADEIEDYSSVYYQNELVYQNNLSLADISGVWEIVRNENSNDKLYFEIKSSGELINLTESESSSIEEVYNGYNELTFSAGSLNFDFIREGDGYNLKIDSSSYPITRSSQKEADDYLIQLEEIAKVEEAIIRAEEKASEQADEIENAKYVVEDFIYYLPDAVNYGSFHYISDYIAAGSDLYTEQFDFVMDLYDRGIGEQLQDFQIRDTAINEDGSISIKTREIFNIYNSQAAEESTSDYTATYTLEKNSNGYQITNISVD